MFVDARTLPQAHILDVDICVIGAGAAGITLARELSGISRKVAVFESGNFDFEPDTQNLYAGEIVGRQYTPLDRDRLRYLGGSTNHWSGSCRPFEPIDLEGWPFGVEVLNPYYRRAQDICQLGTDGFDPGEWKTGVARPIQPAGSSSVRSGVFVYSPPTRFGSVYRDDLRAARNVTVYLNANAVRINTNETASTVTSVEIACLRGPRFSVRARQYLLAAGGIENARLLLNADHTQKTGLGNQNDLVGRYFMDHANVTGAATILADASSPEMQFYDHHEVRGRIIEGYFCAIDQVRRTERLPAHSIGIRSATPVDTELGDIELPSALRGMLRENVVNDITYYLSRSLDRLEAPAKWLKKKMWRTPPGTFTTFYSCGPDPDPQSRVTLLDTVDALGLRQTRLDWHLPADFEQKMQRAHQLLAQELGRTGVGRLRVESAATGQDPMQNLGNGHHHMGTTRMHDDPHQGVVDADCRVHGIANLFIAGSSVFPTYACDDPTMTIVALALRLSDHIKPLV